VYLTTVIPTCAQTAAALFNSPVAVRIAKGDDWVVLAPPGSFG
jgi:hypothetical protein